MPPRDAAPGIVYRLLIASTSELLDVGDADEEANVVELGTVSASAVWDTSVTRTYAIGILARVTGTNTYDFGRTEAIPVIDGQEEHVSSTGIDTNVVVGPSTDRGATRTGDRVDRFGTIVTSDADSDTIMTSTPNGYTTGYTQPSRCFNILKKLK